VTTPEKGWAGPNRVRWFRTFAMNVSQIYERRRASRKNELEGKEVANRGGLIDGLYLSSRPKPWRARLHPQRLSVLMRSAAELWRPLDRELSPQDG